VSRSTPAKTHALGLSKDSAGSEAAAGHKPALTPRMFRYVPGNRRGSRTLRRELADRLIRIVADAKPQSQLA